MLPFAYYIIKVVICSAVLFGYYWFFLRNKLFHRYNRFYLLATIVLSLTLPLLKFNVWQKTAAPKNSVVKILQVVNSSDEYMDEIIIQSHYNHISKEEIAWWAFITICSLFAAMLVKGMIRVYLMKKRNPTQQYEDIVLVKTNDKSTPFSFFKNIFWNNEIDINSTNGKRILKHELAHVQEKHSHDKLFVNMVLVFFWSNPVFWFIRKELNMIHEFIADKKAVEDGDTAAFAAMILAAAYPNQRFELTNNFFYSPIKRRLSMLTKNKTKVSYISRLLVLPLMLFVFAAFTLKAKKYIASLPKDRTITVVIDAGHGGNDNGAASADGIYEKDLTLSLAKKIAELNKSVNIKILLTRETDIYQTPKAKAGLANDLGADLFISIHVDNSPAGSPIEQSGFTAWVARDEFKNADASKLFASSITAAFENNYQLRVASNPMQRKTGITVLQEATCPAVLLEAGFISNKKDLAYLNSSEGKEKFAQNILNAIVSYESSFGNNKTINKVDQKQSLKPVSKVVSPGEISIGYNVPKGSVHVHAGDKTLHENVDYTINYSLGKINIINQSILDAGIPVTVNFDNDMSALSDTNPALKAFRKIETDMFIDASQVSPRNTRDGDFYTLTKLNIQNSAPQPLIIIDGIESTRTRLNEIDAEDIQFIRVLKPETAMPVYGEKGREGVLIVNTKPFNASSPNDRPNISNSNFRVGNIYGLSVEAEEFKKQKTVTVPDGFTFISATVYFSGKNFNDKVVVVRFKKDLSQVKEYLDKCIAGTVVTFDNIKIQGKEGDIQFIEGKSYSLIDENEAAATTNKLPTINLSGISSPDINIKKVPELKELKCSDDNYKVVSAIVYFSGNGFRDAIRTTYSNDGSLKSLETYMGKIVAGTDVTFDNVYISKKDGTDKMEIDGKSFRFYDKYIGDVDRDTLPNKIFTKVENEAEFPGGKVAWQAYLQKNIDSKTPLEEGWKPGTYTIVVSFVVDIHGNASAISSEDHINSKTTQQCLNLIKNGPKWIPAKQNGKTVNSYRKQPITFVVTES